MVDFSSRCGKAFASHRIHFKCACILRRLPPPPRSLSVSSPLMPSMNCASFHSFPSFSTFRTHPPTATHDAIRHGTQTVSKICTIQIKCFRLRLFGRSLFLISSEFMWEFHLTSHNIIWSQSALLLLLLLLCVCANMVFRFDFIA